VLEDPAIRVYSLSPKKGKNKKKKKDFGPSADSLSSACCLLQSSANSALAIRQSVV